ncbi:Arginine N-methyltransferase 2 [Wickerhamomyces ciferrii]|uniref:Arginine N-methyltransferase 2 n=1 Tax=Wickerhamomyces ciferrii (strain ATCC 14091 / BCRC 22168 / CBS 111 / JCM 3599 / NBRC 0793 / NRRL Y-1031 F-60-10) TaxID=1206466 RepID=K0KLV9_WICCF|nr:Arginine N-methyltransferase 2 [Wickerhamomyces ciferrii]CCH43981.1 Arginine N-methyltransferase 2 [Wickerhamomyces ciferrii]
MSELHELCRLQQRPIDQHYIKSLQYFLKEGIPSTYTLEEAENFENGKDEELKSTTTPLHIICSNLPNDLNKDEETVVSEMIDELFSYGAGWNLIDSNGDTPGDILFKQNKQNSIFYEKFVDAGVRAEILLRKINDDIEFISDEEFEVPEAVEEEQQPEEEQEQQQEQKEQINHAPEVQQQEISQEEFNRIKNELESDPANTQKTYLETKLEYKNGALITKDNLDGVMMDWEYELMKAGCETIFKSTIPNDDNKEDINEINILNIGFGMGIIDTMIQEKNPTHHYISEAHPDVLDKLKKDGWYEKSNVTVLEGRWQETLPNLLNEGVFFNGIYYDTYSEHYEDMLELYDIIVGLLKPTGIFSFFNGLGADRQIIYDVYKKIVELDLNNYGMDVKYTELKTPNTTAEDMDNTDESEWIGIKRAYWRCKTYYHPEIKFI